MIIKENESEIVESKKHKVGVEKEDMKDVSPKKKSIAILLNMIFFGAFGLHRFYVGKTKSGGAMLALTVISGGTIGVVWGVIDLFTLIFTDNFTDSDDLPLVGNGVSIIIEYLVAIIFCCWMLYRCVN